MGRLEMNIRMTEWKKLIILNQTVYELRMTLIGKRGKAGLQGGHHPRKLT